MSKPKSYRKQNGCINCKHRWNKINFEYLDLYCTKGVKKIPVNSYHPMDIEEDKRVVDIGSCDNTFADIDKWEDQHSVDEWGICDFYEEKK